LTPEVF